MLGVTGKHSFVFPSIVRLVWLISGCVYWMTVTLAMECAPTFRYDRLVPQRTPPSPQLNPHHPTTPSLVTILPPLLNPKELWNNIERSHQGRRHITNRVLTFVFINSNTDTHYPITSTVFHMVDKRAFLPDDHRGTIIHCLFFVLN